MLFYVPVFLKMHLFAANGCRSIRTSLGEVRSKSDHNCSRSASETFYSMSRFDFMLSSHVTHGFCSSVCPHFSQEAQNRNGLLHRVPKARKKTNMFFGVKPVFFRFFVHPPNQQIMSLARFMDSECGSGYGQAVHIALHAGPPRYRPLRLFCSHLAISRSLRACHLAVTTGISKSPPIIATEIAPFAAGLSV